MKTSDKISDPVGRRGLMLVLSSPSGAGKTSIARRLLEEDGNLTLSISATTRPPRANEVDGRDYHFVDQDRFDRMVAGDEFLEYATVFSYFYGTPKSDVMAALERGEDVLFDIDWQGTQQVANAARTDLVSVHPSAVARGAAAAPRIARAGQRRCRCRTYGQGLRRDQPLSRVCYIVVNEDLDASVDSVRAILSAERLRRDRGRHDRFVRTLQSD